MKTLIATLAVSAGLLAAAQPGWLEQTRTAGGNNVVVASVSSTGVDQPDDCTIIESPRQGWSRGT